MLRSPSVLGNVTRVVPTYQTFSYVGRRGPNPASSSAAHRSCSCGKLRHSSFRKVHVVSTSAIECRALVKRFGQQTAVAAIDLEIVAGECFGLLGPNGAGKTTTVEILEGLSRPDEGDVQVLGRRWTSGADGALRARLGIQLQETKLQEKLSVLETIELFRSFYRLGPTPDEVIRRVALE